MALKRLPAKLFSTQHIKTGKVFMRKKCVEIRM